MAEKIRKRGTRYDKKKPTKKATSGWFRNIVLVFFVGFTFILLSYLGYLDYNVRKQFEGKR